MAHPDYPAYEARRKNPSASDKGFCCSEKTPASESDVRKAEAALGTKLPDGNRKFLLTYGETELWVRLPDDSVELCFYPVSDLVTQRDKVFNFIRRIERDHDKVAAYFRKEYGVSLRHLLPVAQPSQQSHCLLLHLEPGERYGWCYPWDHDSAWELAEARPSFDAAVKALTDGIAQRDAGQLRFLGIYRD